MVDREANYRAPYGKQFHTGSSSADSLTPQSLGLWPLHIIDTQEGVLGKLRLGGRITLIPLDTLYQRCICVEWMKNLNGGFKTTLTAHAWPPISTANTISHKLSPFHQGVTPSIKAPLFASVRGIHRPAIVGPEPKFST
jgi:hypothetical protein